METLPLSTRRLAGLALTLFATLAVAADGRFEVWLTRGDGSVRLQRQADLVLADAPLQAAPLVIRPQQRQQWFGGVGAALTDASAAVIDGMPAAARQHLLAELFGREPGALRLGLVRVSIGGSDFSSRQYSLDDTPDDRPDPDLLRYADAAETVEVRKLLVEARQLNPDLKIFAAPWSPPAWMKAPASLIGGRLRADAEAAYADYLLRFVGSYAAAGVPLYAITVQNEPAYPAPNYASMFMDAGQRAHFYATALGPKLRASPQPPRLLEWDHNWNLPASPLAVLADPAAAPYVDGVAWHCYGGLPAAGAWFEAAMPGREHWVTECSGGSWQTEWPNAFTSMLGTVIIDSLRAGSHGTLLWNLALDPAHGPHSGGCATCRGVVTVAADGQVERNAEYYALAHLSRFASVAATVVGSDSDSLGVRSVALLEPDGETLTIVLENEWPRSVDVAVVVGQRNATLHLDPGSAVTLHGRY